MTPTPHKKKKKKKKEEKRRRLATCWDVRRVDREMLVIVGLASHHCRPSSLKNTTRTAMQARRICFTAFTTRRKIT